MSRQKNRKVNLNSEGKTKGAFFDIELIQIPYGYYAGFRTLDSAVRAKKVFNCKSLIIVSQKFHNQRAVFIAHQNEIDAVGFNAKDVESKNNFTHIREIGAKFIAVLDLFVFYRQPKFL